jgi:hypothetical protein
MPYALSGVERYVGGGYRAEVPTPRAKIGGVCVTELDKLRAELQRLLAEGKRMTDPEVVRVSQELDRVVSEEMRKAAP